MISNQPALLVSRMSFFICAALLLLNVSYLKGSKWGQPIRTLSNHGTMHNDYFTLTDLFPVFHPGSGDELRLSITKPGPVTIPPSGGLNDTEVRVLKIGYRPFDARYLQPEMLRGYGNIQGITGIPGLNTFLNVTRSNHQSHPCTALITSFPVTVSFLSETLPTCMFPLYCMNDKEYSTTLQPKLNLDPVVLNQFARSTGLSFLTADDDRGNVCMASTPDVRPEFRITFNANDVLQYVYNELFSVTPLQHSGIGFPLIRFPSGSDSFWEKAQRGSELIRLHLMRITPGPESLPAFSGAGPDHITYPVTPDSIISDIPEYGTVWINESQSFSGIPLKAWRMRIGEYKPAPLWLASRLNHALAPKDITFYKKLIAVLSEISKLI